jgi:Tol biopolymer transport system component
MDANDKYLVYSYGYISKYRYKYKGSADYNIYIKKRDTKIPVMKITNYDGNDIKPILRDSLIYYISSVNDNKYDIYCYNINSKTIKRITDENININSFSISEDSKTIIYEKEFRLFSLDLASGNKNEIKYQISPDRAQENEYYETISNISNYSISSENDSLFIINSNGDMFLYYPDIINRNLTNSSFWEKNPFYIKNGEFYYTSNKDGYFNIYQGDTTGNFKQITNDTLPEDIICISDNNPHAMLYRTPLGLHLFKKNKSIKIDSGIIYNAIFSPNERYIAYAKKNRSGKSYSVYNIYIYDTKTSLINRITSKGFVCLPITFSQDSKRLISIFMIQKHH